MAEYINIDDQIVVTDTRGRERETTVRHIFEMNKGVYTAADVVERKRGKWIDRDDVHYGWNTWQCSVCGDEFILEEGTPDVNGYNFCPNCGADMRGEDDV